MIKSLDIMIYKIMYKIYMYTYTIFLFNLSTKGHTTTIYKYTICVI